ALLVQFAEHAGGELVAEAEQAVRPVLPAEQRPYGGRPACPRGGRGARVQAAAGQAGRSQFVPVALEPQVRGRIRRADAAADGGDPAAAGIDEMPDDVAGGLDVVDADVVQRRAGGPL